MRLHEFVDNPQKPAPSNAILEKAKRMIEKMVSQRYSGRAAVTTTMDILHQAGVELSQAAQIAKQAFTLVTGQNVMVESLRSSKERAPHS